jgi:hypothetical protein
MQAGWKMVKGSGMGSKMKSTPNGEDNLNEITVKW